MRVSNRLDYAVRALLELTLRAGQGPVPTREIARAQSIPEAFAHQVLGALVKEGMIRTLRGPGGGHQLMKAPEATTLLDIVEAVDGRSMASPHTPFDAVSDIWGELDHLQRAYLASVTLASLARAAQERTVAAGYTI